MVAVPGGSGLRLGTPVGVSFSRQCRSRRPSAFPLFLAKAFCVTDSWAKAWQENVGDVLRFHRPSPLRQQMVGLGPRAGEGSANSTGKTPAPASLAGGCSLAGGYQDRGSHSPLPQDPAAGGAGTGSPLWARGSGAARRSVLRCCVWLVPEHEEEKPEGAATSAVGLVLGPCREVKPPVWVRLEHPRPCGSGHDEAKASPFLLVVSHS
ncbi:unnamed protein product [Bubo scandiacus]